MQPPKRLSGKFVLPPLDLLEQPLVCLRDILESDEWRKTDKSIPVAIGRDESGHPIIGDLAQLPHLLIGGATGSVRAVCINAILASLLYRFTADELRLVLIDPTMVEMQQYNALPHLITPVVTKAEKVPPVLNSVIRKMESRFQIFVKEGVRNISGFNGRIRKRGEFDADVVISDKLPFIVVVVTELANLMATVGKDVEMAIARLTALGRAAGIHLIVATQQPSVNVVTGVIKANIPCRIAFQVASMQDSHVILDSPGAEKLLGKGEMLYEPGTGKAVRAQGVLVLDKEIDRIVDFIGETAKLKFKTELAEELARSVNLPDNEDEELLEQYIVILRRPAEASVPDMQRRLRLGYTRASRIMELLEARGIVDPKTHHLVDQKDKSMSVSTSIIRNSAKAIIVRDGCVLLIRIGDQSGEWYVLPGGGQQHGESLRETVQRECLEEIGVPVQVGELRLVREFIGKNHDDDEGVHRVEFMFECQIDAAAVPNGGLRQDSQQTGIVWVPLAGLKSYCLYPTGLVQILRNGFAKVGCAYMGDVV